MHPTVSPSAAFTASTAYTPFADLIATRTRNRASVTFHIPDDWLQGRTAFGGLIAAIGVQAMHDMAAAAWPAEVRLRALQTHFVGPVAPGTAEVTVQVLREGKSVRQVQASVVSQGQVAALLVGVYGSPRASAVGTLSPRQPVLRRAAGDAPTQPLAGGVMPAFLQHFDIGLAAGDPPYSGGTGWQSSLYLRLAGDHADQVDRDVLMVLLADAPPSPALSRLRRPAPASSVCWALELLPLTKPVAADGWWRIDTQARSASEGYVNHTSILWTAAGEAAAFGHQVVMVYG